MKVIALIPFKNEEEFLPSCLKSLKPVCDEIICIDDNSTDDSASIAENLGAVVYKNNQLVDFGWSEHHIRTNLLNIARERNGTHFVCLDADETLSSQFQKNGRSIISNLKPGQKLGMQWLALWKSFSHYRDDATSVWSNSFKDFIVCDDGKIFYEYRWLHVPRTPGENNDKTFLRLNPKYGAVLHFQFSNWEKFQIKQCYLKCTELIKKPGLEFYINKDYSITMDSPLVTMKEMPKEWYDSIEMPVIKNIDWRLQKTFEYFDKYGIEYFEKLEIWHLSYLKEEFIKRTGREPK